MKKIIIPVALLIITSLVLYSCSLLKSLEEVKKNGYSCNNYSTYPINEMNKTEVLELIRNYYKNQYAAINSVGINFNGSIPATQTIKVDSRAVFFNLDTLKRLIYYIEKASENFPKTDRDNLGVNIYYGAYTAAMQVQKHGYDYTNRHTLVMIPSIFNSASNTAKDFDLYNSLNAINVDTPSYINNSFLENPINTKIAGLSANQSVTGRSSMYSQNHGTAIPPPPSPTGNVILEATDPF
jgi:hypothetical protein